MIFRLYFCFFLCVFAFHCENAFSFDSFYIWQRNWTSLLLETLHKETEAPAFCYLAGEFNAVEGNLNFTRIDVPENIVKDKRFTPVYRIFLSAIKDWDNLPNFASYIKSEAKKFHSLQLDFDCPESKLAYYPVLLKQFRNILPENAFLSATVLPCHLKHKTTFKKLIDECDFYVLQVHGLDIRNESLMNAKTALNAIREARGFKSKFMLALPCYAYQLNYRKADGAFLYVNAENIPHPDDSILVKTIEASYSDIAECVRSVRNENAKNCIGIIWFRLPLPGDRLSLDRKTVSELSAGKIPEKRLIAQWKKAEDNVIVLRILNRGILDGRKLEITLKWQVPPSISDAMLLNYFRSETPPFMMDKEYTLQGVLPPPGMELDIMWLRTTQNWNQPLMEFKIK